MRELTLKGRRSIGAVTDQGSYSADTVVMNAYFTTAMTTLVPDSARRRWNDRKIASRSYSCATLMLYLGIDGQLPLNHHTVAFSADYQRNVAEIDAGQVPEDPTIYVQNPSVIDPTLAPEGHSTLYVLAPVGNLIGGADWTLSPPHTARRCSTGWHIWRGATFAR